MSKVFVVTTNERCPAISALRSERIPFEVVTVEGTYDYGQFLHAQWVIGEEFVFIEHDIVPWPGAVQALLGCKSHWCIYQNMIGHSGKLQSALGIVRFSQRLMEVQEFANFGWDKTEWNHLDAQVYGALEVDRKFHPHIHTPPVAHLTDMKELKVYGETHRIDDAWVMPRSKTGNPMTAWYND